MNKVIAILIILLPSVVWATTYNIGPGQTYETFTALVAAETLTAGDIVDGGNNTFTEKWTPDGNGSSGNVITLRNATIDCPADQNAGLSLYGRSFITVSNIDFTGGQSGEYRQLYLVSAHDIVIDSCAFSGCDTNNMIRGGDEAATNTYNITVSGCTFTGDGSERAIYFQYISATTSSYSITVSGCTFSNVKNALWFGGSEDPIGLNDTSPYGLDFNGNTVTGTTEHAIGISCGLKSTAQSYIRNNTFTTIGNGLVENVNAIGLNWCRGVIVEFNTINGVDTASTDVDGHGIIVDWAWYSDSYISDGVIVRYNKITGCDNTTTAAGIEVYKGTNTQVYGNYSYNNIYGITSLSSISTGGVFYHNTLTGNTNGGAARTLCPATTWKNNIFYNNTTGFYVQSGATAPTETYNCFNGNTADGVTPDATDLTSDPTLSGYTLLTGSPCINAGTNVNVGRDIDNKLRTQGVRCDIGAYEYPGGQAECSGTAGMH